MSIELRPPFPSRRSSGNNQAKSLWGDAYAANANNNILVMIQIESPAGVGIIDNILSAVEGIDIVMVASNDFGMCIDAQ